VLKKAGLKVDDIIEVLQTLEHAGALYGRLEII
jgi:flagellar basal body P-ring protein FlgI